MKKYQRRNYVKAKARERYIQKKIEDAQLDIPNEELHADNTERFTDYAQR